MYGDGNVVSEEQYARPPGTHASQDEHHGHFSSVERVESIKLVSATIDDEAKQGLLA